MSRVALVLVVSMACAGAPPVAPEVVSAPAPPISWERFGRAAFERARRERRIVIVSVQTQWCHWCHVMNDETWSDPSLRALVAERFVIIRADADAEPEVGERYAAWGWPAIAILSPDGEPVMELRGHQPLQTFLPLLIDLAARVGRSERLARREAPAPASARAGTLEELRALAEAQLDGFFDAGAGGWGKTQKYPLTPPIVHALYRSERGTPEDGARQQARVEQTLDGQERLVDPIDGGMFQYSLSGTWTDPHFEKLVDQNGAALEAFALGHRLGRAGSTLAGRRIHHWLTTTMRAPDGAFFASQDADVGTRGDHPRLRGAAYYALSAGGRRTAGAPFVDARVFASHNGRAIAGLARFGAAVGDAAMVADAARAMDAIDASHTSDDGYAHAAGDRGRLLLADQVAVLEASLALDEVAGRSVDRARAHRLAALLTARFSDARGRLLAHTADPDAPALEVRTPLRLNAEAARLLIRLGRLEHDDALIARGQKILEAVGTPDAVATEGRFIGELVLALVELLDEPLQFAVVGARDDPRTARLRTASLAAPGWWRVVQTRLPDDRYPDQGQPTLFLCGARFCSPPITDPARVAEKAAAFLPRATSR